ncbi:hypothetical protein F1880_006437 [Penicillium rolfsii]|nr:hypothetical protein F1880_006437 [Penicillium rolfsii]
MAPVAAETAVPVSTTAIAVPSDGCSLSGRVPGLQSATKLTGCRVAGLMGFWRQEEDWDRTEMDWM